MHRNERIAHAISTLGAIEQAVVAKLGLGSMADVPEALLPSVEQKIDNVVRLYCASDVANAVGSAAPP